MWRYVEETTVGKFQSQLRRKVARENMETVLIHHGVDVKVGPVNELWHPLELGRKLDILF
jgi:hypothetical protein